MEQQPFSPLAAAPKLRLNVPLPAPSRQTQLIQEFKKYKSSAAPARFLHFKNSSWLDFDHQVFDVLLHHFTAGRTSAEAVVEGIVYLFDFLRMLQVEVDSGVANSIAWIDVKGSFFFPNVAVDGRTGGGVALDGAFPAVVCDSDSSARESVVLHPEYSDESPGASTTESPDRPRWPGVLELSSGDKYYKTVEKIFLSQMRRFASEVVITNICKCLHSGSQANARLRSFQAQLQTMNAKRGDAQVKIGWFGASATELSTIVGSGFEETNSRLLGQQAFGSGVHLSSLQFPHLSSLLAEADEGGEMHLVLCRVIMGKPERIEAGSRQFCPSSDEFDCGVDSTDKPKWYIVWSRYMNTHILPECVISFRCIKQLQGSLKMVNPVRKPSASNLSFTKLIAELARVLPASMIQSVQFSYNQFKGGRISKDTFIRCLRSLVGDKLLTLSIRKIRGY